MEDYIASKKGKVFTVGRRPGHDEGNQGVHLRYVSESLQESGDIGAVGKLLVPCTSGMHHPLHRADV